MSNWIESNPTKSIIIYSITLVAATFTVLYFILIENQANLHHTETQSLKTQIQTLNERIQLLQYDNSHYIDENNQLKDWLKSTPNSLEYLKRQNKTLERKLFQISLLNNNDSLTNDNINYYNQSDLLSTGKAFLDSKTSASIAISAINIDREAFGVLHLPGKKTVSFKKVKAGHQWNFKYQGQKFSLILMELNYVGEKYRVALNEE